VAIEYVLELCGEPAERVVTDEPIRAFNPDGTSWVVGTTRSEILTYDRGSGRFPALLTFDDGRLVRIEYDMQRR
jgi:hypothetical protein